MRAREAVLAIGLLIVAACEEGEDDDGTQAHEPVSAFQPTDAQRAEILAVVQSVFDALAGDPDLLADVMVPDVVMHSTEAGPDGIARLSSSTLASLEERIRSSETRMIERMWDAEVRISGDLATVWTPYDFYVGDAFSHCGVDVATLIRTSEGWRIVGLGWNRQQPPECALHPNGPPR